MRNILKLACVLFCIVGLVPNLMGCNKITKSFSTRTRDEIKAKLTVGMSKQAVIDALGTPDDTSESGDISRFFYRNKVLDPITGKVDRQVMVSFDKQGYTGINF